MEITIPEKKVTVPNGNRCVCWNPEEQREGLGFECKYYVKEVNHISTSEAINSGLGYSAGSIEFHICRLFNYRLKYKYGDGVYKCLVCSEQ